MELRANVPDGPIDKKWDKHRFDMKLVNPANKRKYRVIIVGTGLAGASAAALVAALVWLCTDYDITGPAAFIGGFFFTGFFAGLFVGFLSRFLLGRGLFSRRWRRSRYGAPRCNQCQDQNSGEQ